MEIEKSKSRFDVDMDSGEVESEDHYNIKNLPESYLKTLNKALYDQPTSREGVEEMREEIEEALKNPEERLEELGQEDERSIQEQLRDKQ